MLGFSTGALINSYVNDMGDENYKNDKIEQFRIV
jgi:hypothetical protein